MLNFFEVGLGDEVPAVAGVAEGIVGGPCWSSNSDAYDDSQMIRRIEPHRQCLLSGVPSCERKREQSFVNAATDYAMDW